MKITSLFFGVILLFIACKQDASKPSDEPNTPPQSKLAALPYLTNMDIQGLLAKTETVDMIFFHLPISVSQDDAASARNSVMDSSPATPAVADTCRAAGRMSWMSQGVILKEADFYLGQGCYQFVFIEDNKAAYRNAMSSEAIQFFETILKQVNQKPNQ